MKADDLHDLGFSAWAPFNKAHKGLILDNLPELPGLYAIAGPSQAQKLGNSDLVYIGCAANQEGLRRRVRQYFHPGSSQRTSQRINSLVMSGAQDGLSYAVAPSIETALRWEIALISAYRFDHAQLPRENRTVSAMQRDVVLATLSELAIFEQPDWETQYQRASCSVCGARGRVLLAGGDDPFYRGTYVAVCDCG